MGESIFNIINRKNSNLPMCTMSAGWTNILANYSLDKLLENIKNNNLSLKYYLCQIKNERDITYSQISIDSNIKQSIVKDYFNGRRKPNRDALIGLCFAFKLNYEESNMLLKIGKYNELYPRNEKDLVIAKCIVESMDLKTTNEILCRINPKYKIGNRDEEEG